MTCCVGHHAMGCADDPPATVCCWRCTVNPSASPEAFRAALVHDVPGLTPCGDDDCRVCWGDTPLFDELQRAASEHERTPDYAKPVKTDSNALIAGVDPLADEPEFVAVQRQNEEAAKRDRQCPWCDHWLLAGHLAEGCTFCECRVRIAFAPHPGFLVSPARARMLVDIDAADEDD